MTNVDVRASKTQNDPSQTIWLELVSSRPIVDRTTQRGYEQPACWLYSSNVKRTSNFSLSPYYSSGMEAMESEENYIIDWSSNCWTLLRSRYFEVYSGRAIVCPRTCNRQAVHFYSHLHARGGYFRSSTSKQAWIHSYFKGLGGRPTGFFHKLYLYHKCSWPMIHQSHVKEVMAALIGGNRQACIWEDCSMTTTIVDLIKNHNPTGGLQLFAL